MSPVKLTVGANQIDRIIPNADDLLLQYRHDTGCFYKDYQPLTPYDRVVPEDLSVTLLVNSQVGWRAFHSLMEYSSTINLAALPPQPLEHTSLEERKRVSALIAQIARFPGFAASVATKVLHKKRPDLIPILDNQAIFGAYMNADWPNAPARTESVKNPQWIFNAINWISYDINRLENQAAWETLQAIEPSHTRIQLFDSVWWMYFRQTQPVARR